MATDIAIVTSSPYAAVFSINATANDPAYLATSGSAAHDIVLVSALAAGPFKALLQQENVTIARWQALATDPRIALRWAYPKNGAITAYSVNTTLVPQVGITFAPINPGVNHVAFQVVGPVGNAYIEFRFIPSNQR